MRFEFRWNSKKSEKHFTIFEGIELDIEENPPTYTSENIFIQIPRTKIESINYIRLYLKCRERTCQLYRIDNKIIENLIQKLKRIELEKFQVFKKVIEILPQISFDFRKIASRFQSFIRPLSSFLEIIKFHEFKDVTIYTSSGIQQNSSKKFIAKVENEVMVISDDDEEEFLEEESEDLNEKEIESRKIRFFSKSSGNYFPFHTGKELENSQQEIKLENIFILVCKVIPVEKMNHLRIGVKHQGGFGIIHDIKEFLGPLIQDLKSKENQLNQKLFPVVISLLECYSPEIFFKNSKRNTKLISNANFKKEIEIGILKENSPIFLKRNIPKEIKQKEMEPQKCESDSEEDPGESSSDDSSMETSIFISSDYVSIWMNSIKKEFPVNQQELKKFSFHSWDSIVSLKPNTTPLNLIYNENVLRIIFKIINKETIQTLNLNNEELFQLFKFFQLNSKIEVSLEIIELILNNLKHSLDENSVEYQYLMSRVYQHQNLEFAQSLILKLISHSITPQKNVDKKRKRISEPTQKSKK
jgi:hypothetical protein